MPECKKCGEFIENEDDAVSQGGVCLECLEETTASCWGAWDGF